jgi:hypothetical protein
MLLGRRVVAAAISLVLLAVPWVLGLGAFLWTFAATDSRWMAFAVSVLLAWIAYMAIQFAVHFLVGKETMRRAALGLAAVLAAAI